MISLNEVADDRFCRDFQRLRNKLAGLVMFLTKGTCGPEEQKYFAQALSEKLDQSDAPSLPASGPMTYGHLRSMLASTLETLTKELKK